MVENVSISAQSSLTVIFIALAKQELNKQANKQPKKTPKMFYNGILTRNCEF